MSAKMPCVRGTYVEDPHQPDCRIPLDTPAWFRWLEAPTTSWFTYPVFGPRVGYIVGFMTVRNERRERGGPIGQCIGGTWDGCGKSTWGVRVP